MTVPPRLPLPELAFSARLVAPEAGPPGVAEVALGGPVAAHPAASKRAGEALDSQASAASWGTGDAAKQPRGGEIPAGSQDAFPAPAPAQPASSNGEMRDNTRSASIAQRDAHTSPATAQCGRSPANMVPQAAASSNDHSDRGANQPPGQENPESAVNAAAPLPMNSAAPSATRTSPASQPRPAAEPSEPAAQPVSRDVALHLDEGDSRVDIRMAERAGEIRVTVHTADRALADSLRSDLPDLVGKLRQNGFQAEAWRPAAAPQADTGRRGDAAPFQDHSPGGRRDGRQREAHQQQSKKQWTGAWKSSLDAVQEPDL